MKITLPAIVETGFEDVAAELLDIAPHLAAVGSFAVHKAVPSDSTYAGWWFVTNIETGCWVSYDKQRTTAIRKAQERLKEKTPESVLRAYRKVQAHGRSTGDQERQP